MNLASIVAEGIGWPEGLRWHDGLLWFSDVFGRRMVHSLDEAGTMRDRVEVPNCPSGLGWTPDGDLLVVSMNDCLLLRVPAGSTTAEVACDLSALAVVTNDMTVAPNGTAYIGDNGFHFGEEDAALGRILKVTPDGEASVVAEGMYMPNGMVISPDGRHLIVAETLGGRLSRFPIGSDGDLGARESFHAFDDLGWVTDMNALMQRAVVPDGICVDAAGSVWVGNPLSPEVICVTDTGKVVDRVRLSQPGITCALGGPDGHSLFVATGVLGDQAGTQGRVEMSRVATPAS